MSGGLDTTPPIAFSGQPLDRADHLRADPDALRRMRGEDALLLALDGLAPDLDENGRLRWLPLSAAPADAELVFLGLLRRNGRPAFAALPAAGRAAAAGSIAARFNAMATLSADDLASYGLARSLVDWHARHRFCAECGAPTLVAKGGWQRDCPACSASHFPRCDPVAIMLVEHDGRMLLGRQARFPPGFYSALAGFVEPGETMEEAVAREVLEEAGVPVERVRYIASQPWPYPSQLMLGCIADATDDRLAIDRTELEDARWFARAEVAAALAGEAGAPFVAPPAQAIARTLLEWWLAQA